MRFRSRKLPAVLMSAALQLVLWRLAAAGPVIMPHPPEGGGGSGGGRRRQSDPCAGPAYRVVGRHAHAERDPDRRGGGGARERGGAGDRRPARDPSGASGPRGGRRADRRTRAAPDGGAGWRDGDPDRRSSGDRRRRQHDRQLSDRVLALSSADAAISDNTIAVDPGGSPAPCPRRMGSFSSAAGGPASTATPFPMRRLVSGSPTWTVRPPETP